MVGAIQKQVKRCGRRHHGFKKLGGKRKVKKKKKTRTQRQKR